MTPSRALDRRVSRCCPQKWRLLSMLLVTTRNNVAAPVRSWQRPELEHLKTKLQARVRTKHDASLLPKRLIVTTSCMIRLSRKPYIRQLAKDRAAAVVIGLDSMQGLQTARILHGHGIPVIAIAGDKRHCACKTNACKQILYSDTGVPALVDTLERLAASLSLKAVLFPCQDKSVRIISQFCDRLSERFAIMLPPAATVDMLMDKSAFYDYATKQGLRVPVTHELHDRNDALAIAATIPYPCMLKPSYRADAWDRNTLKKVFRIENAEELVARYDMCSDWADVLIAQQWVEGGDDTLYSCNCYFGRDGRPLVTFVARKLRQWPPEAGTSCLGEEVREDIVLETTTTLFSKLGYRGLGYLEMKRDANSGEYFIIEPNVGRPTGRSAIAEHGGVALLYTMYCDALNLTLPPNRTQQYRGTKWIDLRHDLQSAFWYWRKDKLTVSEWLRSIRGRKAHSVFAWRDPRPFLSDLARAATMYFKR